MSLILYIKSNADIVIMPPPPQEQTSSVQSPSSWVSSAVLMGSSGVDREVLKRAAIGLTLAAAILALLVEKLF